VLLVVLVMLSSLNSLLVAESVHLMTGAQLPLYLILHDTVMVSSSRTVPESGTFVVQTVSPSAIKNLSIHTTVGFVEHLALARKNKNMQIDHSKFTCNTTTRRYGDAVGIVLLCPACMTVCRHIKLTVAYR